jgi:hypothetical protein
MVSADRVFSGLLGQPEFGDGNRRRLCRLRECLRVERVCSGGATAGAGVDARLLTVGSITTSGSAEKACTACEANNFSACTKPLALVSRTNGKNSDVKNATVMHIRYKSGIFFFKVCFLLFGQGNFFCGRTKKTSVLMSFWLKSDCLIDAPLGLGFRHREQAEKFCQP